MMKPNHFLFRMKSSSRIKQQQFLGATLRSTSHASQNDPWKTMKKNQEIKREITNLKRNNLSEQKVKTIKECQSSSIIKRNEETLSSLEKLKKADLSTADLDEVKKRIIFSKSNDGDGIKQMKNFLQSTKKLHQKSQKIIDCRELRTVFTKGEENHPYRHNTIVADQPSKSHRSTQNEALIKSYKDITQQKILSKKDFMKIFIHKNKTREQIPSSSQHLIEPHHNEPEYLQKTQTAIKYPSFNCKMFKTNIGFTKNKEPTTSLPYLQLSKNKLKQQQKQSKKIIKKIEEESEHDVSIQLSQSIAKEESQNFPSLSQSSINEQEERNDSSFLGDSDKKVFENLIMEDKSEVLKLSDRPKRQWKKLPDDFMKG